MKGRRKSHWPLSHWVEAQSCATEQRQDTTLDDLCTLARTGDEIFAVTDHLLFRRTRMNSDDRGNQRRNQSLIPLRYRDHILDQILKAPHRSSGPEHKGIKAMLAQITEDFNWPTNTKDVLVNVEARAECRRTAIIKVNARKTLIETTTTAEIGLGLR